MLLRNHDQERMLTVLRTTLDGALIVALYLGGILALNMPVETFTNWAYFATIVGASLGGAVVLAYFRRDLSYKEMFFKVGCASIIGVICGSLLTTYFAFEATPYILASYFFSSLLGYFFIRAILNVTEQNASGFVITFIQTFFRTGADFKQNAIVPKMETTTVVSEVAVKPVSTDQTVENQTKL